MFWIDAGFRAWYHDRMSKIQNIKPGHRVTIVTRPGTTSASITGTVLSTRYFDKYGTWQIDLDRWAMDFDPEVDQIQVIRPTARFLIRREKTWEAGDQSPRWKVWDRQYYGSTGSTVVIAPSFEAARQGLLRYMKRQS